MYVFCMSYSQKNGRLLVRRTYVIHDKLGLEVSIVKSVSISARRIVNFNVGILPLFFSDGRF